MANRKTARRKLRTPRKPHAKPSNSRPVWIGIVITSIVLAALTYLNLRSSPAQPAPIDVVSTSTPTKMWFMVTTKSSYNDQLPPDYRRMFGNPEEWALSRKYMDALFFGYAATHSNLFDPGYLANKVVPLLKSSNIKIGLDSGVATWLKCRGAGGENNIQGDLNVINKIVQAGGTVSYIRLQSTLSKAVPSNISFRCPNYSIDDRIADAVRYTKAIHAVYPDIKFGIADATTSHILKSKAGREDDYQTTLRKFKTALTSNNIPLDFFILDMGVENAEGTLNPGALEYPELLKLESFIKNDLGLRFGMILISHSAGDVDETAFYNNIISFVKKYRNMGGNPDIYMPESWEKYPWYLLPEDSTTSYPHLKLFLDLSKIVVGNPSQIDQVK